MDAIDRIEELIVEGSQGLFDDSHIREDLHVTIRIAADFYNFLMQFGNQPPAKEIDYLMGTIRSGMDEFFAVAYCSGTMTGSDTWTFDTHTNWDFPHLREIFLRGFESLVGSNDASVDNLAALLALTHLELVFLAQNFPTAILGDLAGTSRPRDRSGNPSER